MGIELVGIAIDCEWAEPVARFYEGLLGLEIRDLGPRGRWAQLFNPNGGVHLNIQGDARYKPPVWPEEPGELTKMLHFEVQVDDLVAAVALAIEVGGAEAPWQPPDRNRDRLRIMLDPAGPRSACFSAGSSPDRVRRSASSTSPGRERHATCRPWTSRAQPASSGGSTPDRLTVVT